MTDIMRVKSHLLVHGKLSVIPLSSNHLSIQRKSSSLVLIAVANSFLAGLLDFVSASASCNSVGIHEMADKTPELIVSLR